MIYVLSDKLGVSCLQLYIDINNMDIYRPSSLDELCTILITRLKPDTPSALIFNYPVRLTFRIPYYHFLHSHCISVWNVLT